MLKHVRVIMDKSARAIMVIIFGVYKEHISPLMQTVFHQPSIPVCRFYPSCSLYAKEAFTHKTFWRAFYLTALRVARCRPGGGQGFDPVL